jgi:hypothetical protein
VISTQSRRWIKEPKKRDFRGEITAATQLLAWLRQEFPGVPIIFKAGNHEERWKHWLWQHAPEISATTHAWASISGWTLLSTASS